LSPFAASEGEQSAAGCALADTAQPGHRTVKATMDESVAQNGLARPQGGCGVSEAKAQKPCAVSRRTRGGRDVPLSHIQNPCMNDGMSGKFTFFDVINYLKINKIILFSNDSRDIEANPIKFYNPYIN